MRTSAAWASWRGYAVEERVVAITVTNGHRRIERRIQELALDGWRRCGFRVGFGFKLLGLGVMECRGQTFELGLLGTGFRVEG